VPDGAAAVSDETTQERVQRLMAAAFSEETGGGACTWAYESLGDVWDLHNPSAGLAVKVTGKMLLDLACWVDEIEWMDRDTGRRLARFERVASGSAEAVFE
jgi:hypothetical protein